MTEEKSMGAIDVWAQILTERMAREPWLQTLLRWTGREGGIVLPSVPETLAEMDRAGVDVALLSAWHGPSGALIENEEVARQIEVAPDRFRGLATADIQQPMEAVRTIRSWLAVEGFVGVRIVPWLWDLPPNDRRYYPIYAACVEAGVPLCTQIGHTGPLKRSEPGRLIPYLEDVLLDFPELVVVGGHVGYPWIDELVTLTVKFPNFHVDTSAYALHRLPAAFVDYLRGVGRGRVLFGTNWPMLSPSRCLAGLPALELDDQARDGFLFGTARRLFGLGGAA
jgi:predicted TIM-barrel fold metal-dependent hydrolase